VPSPPLIAVDALALGSRPTGNARTLLNLLAHLPAADPGLRYVAFVRTGGEHAVRGRAPDVEVRVVRPQRGLAWELRGAAREAAAAGAELLLTMRELVPLGGVPILLHVFEPPAYRLRAVGRLTRAEARRYAKDVLLHVALRRSLRRARAVTAGSRTTADWLRAHAGIEAAVVLPGIDPVFFADDPGRQAERPYVLHVASGDPRDNTDLVLRALASGRCDGIRLVVVGTPVGLQRRLERRAAALRVDLELAGWVSDEHLRELYRGALAVAHPTKYEGFGGYPALEAMALGTPVVALDAPGSHEALAGRGLLVPREDPILLAEAIARLRADPELRARLSADGRAFARSLTWETAAAGFASAIRRALEQ
jgi:glycosyltransferase involved in cell wall biosynthesis